MEDLLLNYASRQIPFSIPSNINLIVYSVPCTSQTIQKFIFDVTEEENLLIIMHYNGTNISSVRLFTKHFSRQSVDAKRCSRVILQLYETALSTVYILVTCIVVYVFKYFTPKVFFSGKNT